MSDSSLAHGPAGGLAGDSVGGPAGDSVGGPAGDSVGGPAGDSVGGLAGDSAGGPVGAALVISGLTVDVPDGTGPGRRFLGRRAAAGAGRRVVDGLDLVLPRGRVVALVGPSGSGKSLTARSIVGLHRDGVRVGGSITLDGGPDLLSLSGRELRAVRGSRVGYAFQDATASLNPTITVGRHLTETLRAHRSQDATGNALRDRGREALRRCGLDADAVWDARPFELSGGQAQRAALALATVLGPDVLVADEVTTALDPVTQAEVLDAVRAQARDEGRAVLLITHDLAVAGRWADEIAVITGGRVVEHGPSGTVLADPEHTFTRSLVAAARLEPPPRPPLADRSVSDAGGTARGADRDASGADADVSGADADVPDTHAGGGGEGAAALSLRGVRRVLGGHGRGRTTVALDGIDLDVREGEAVAVVGRSGSGKSTLVGVLAALDRPQDGSVVADGRDVWSLRDGERRALRRRTGLVFQDALASFDPRHTVRRVVAEAAEAADGTAVDGDVEALLTRVGLDPGLADRRPATLSGGERQRVALARALASRPRVLLADEPTTGLDVLTQAHVLALLDELRRDEGLAIVFVTHDLRVARRVADRVVVLADGRVVDDLPATALDLAEAAARPCGRTRRGRPAGHRSRPGRGRRTRRGRGCRIRRGRGCRIRRGRGCRIRRGRGCRIRRGRRPCARLGRRHRRDGGGDGRPPGGHTRPPPARALDESAALPAATPILDQPAH
ncbi:ABC transporter ATP-binding protein [Actinomadura logoneensis]|uniref:ABC transporter ATP-binding protein n=1 Tax=Actinomadura logoneensis TaxID=2293572 RepID=UPI001313E98D|nr:ABC transporter ATP-binding protein [Actinomadura logoneensis]